MSEDSVEDETINYVLMEIFCKSRDRNGGVRLGSAGQKRLRAEPPFDRVGMIVGKNLRNGQG